MATWKDISIEKYGKIAALQESGLGEIDLIAAVISIIDGSTVKEVEEIPYGTLLLKARGLRFLQSDPIPSIVKKSYNLNGVKYIPTLNPAELTTAQYIDFQVRATQDAEDLAGLLSVLLIPEGHKYNEGYSADQVKEDINKFLPIEDAMGLSSFFFYLWKKSIRRLLRESKRTLRQLKRKRKPTEAEKSLIETTEKMIETIKTLQRYY